MDVNLNLYKIFDSVVRNKSMTKAAEELSISQPAITKAMKTLEEQIGGTLLLRSNKGLELTSEGKMLYEQISVALKIINDAENLLSSFFDLQTGEVRIGISTVLSKILLMDVICLFNEKYPHVKISIINGLTSDLLDDLSKGKLDFVIFNEGKGDIPKLKLEKLISLQYSLVYNPEKYIITDIKDLEKEENTLILQKKGSYTRDFIDDFLKIHDVQIETKSSLMEVVSHEFIYGLIQRGIGVGFVYDALVNNHRLEKIVCDDLFNDIYIAQHKSIIPTKATQEFLKILKQNAGASS